MSKLNNNFADAEKAVFNFISNADLHEIRIPGLTTREREIIHKMVPNNIKHVSVGDEGNRVLILTKSENFEEMEPDEVITDRRRNMYAHSYANAKARKPKNNSGRVDPSLLSKTSKNKTDYKPRYLRGLIDLESKAFYTGKVYVNQEWAVETLRKCINGLGLCTVPIHKPRFVTLLFFLSQISTSFLTHFFQRCPSSEWPR